MLTYLPTIPENTIVEYQQIIPYSVISSPQNSYRVQIVGIPQNFVVCGTRIRLLTQFVGSSLTSLQCSLGAFVPNSILSDLNFYGTSIELTQIPTATTFSLSGPLNNNLSNPSASFSPATALYFNGPHDIAAYFQSTGTTLNNLTAGVVEVVVQIRPC